MVEEVFRITVKKGDVEVTVEGTDRSFVEDKTEELIRRMIEGRPTEGVEFERKKEELRKFFKEKAPRKHTEFILVLGYWHQHVEGKGEFTTKDIANLYDMVNLPLPESLNSQFFRLSRGDKPLLLKGTRRGRYMLSEDGKRVVEMLPERPKRRRKKGK
ncbi:MAG: hypothetical protein J7L88_01185 [Thermoplasmata archaeon]|nr:hypothetical protein [Thermoplasmata archaeon]